MFPIGGIVVPTKISRDFDGYKTVDKTGYYFVGKKWLFFFGNALYVMNKIFLYALKYYVAGIGSMVDS